MPQHREPPAFQEYAATMMASIDFRTMSLAARGLLYTMRLECWVNRQLPSDPARLALMLGFDATEVSALLPKVIGFFGKVRSQLSTFLSKMGVDRQSEICGALAPVALMAQLRDHKDRPLTCGRRIRQFTDSLATPGNR